MPFQNENTSYARKLTGVKFLWLKQCPVLGCSPDSEACWFDKSITSTVLLTPQHHCSRWPHLLNKGGKHILTHLLHVWKTSNLRDDIWTQNLNSALSPSKHRSVAWHLAAKQHTSYIQNRVVKVESWCQLWGLLIEKKKAMEVFL